MPPTEDRGESMWLTLPAGDEEAMRVRVGEILNEYASDPEAHERTIDEILEAVRDA